MLKTLGKHTSQNLDKGKTDFGFNIPYPDIMAQFQKNPFYIDYEIFGIYFLFNFIKNTLLKHIKPITSTKIASNYKQLI